MEYNTNVQPPRDQRSTARLLRWTRRLAWWAWVSAVAGAAGVVIAVAFLYQRWTGEAHAASSLRLEDIPFDGQRAYEDLKRLCALGPRPSGSAGMRAQQQLLREHFGNLGAQVRLQEFTARHPVDGSPVAMANLIVTWHPDARERVLLCAHYDTLPLPMLDPVDPRGVFVGANDGASGTAILMELGREMAGLRPRWGVDFVFFDGEEFIFSEQHPYFLGSEHFARQYRDNPPPYRYRYAVLLDMVGDADLQIYQEQNSMWWRDTRPLVLDIWGQARRLGVREFIPRIKYEIRDDHLSLRNIAGIPACVIIDFDYPAWHTRQDIPEQCSALSLAKVGWVIRQWLERAR